MINKNKYMYFENQKTLLRKKFLKELNEWKDILCLWIRRLNIVKMALLSNYYTDPIHPIKIPSGFFTEIDADPQIHMETQDQEFSIQS